jgi:hypothetical protein
MLRLVIGAGLCGKLGDGNVLLGKVICGHRKPT